MGYDNPESIHRALGDEELMHETARVLRAVKDDPESGVAQDIANGGLTEEQLGIMVAVIVCHETDKFYPGALRAIGDRATQIGKPMDPTNFDPTRPALLEPNPDELL
jgi:hypothetical protein